jgi:hypothetical protein
VVCLKCMANGEGGIRYWAVQSGWVGVEGGGIKEACLGAARTPDRGIGALTAHPN